MEFEADPKRIQRLAEQREDANWAFRSFLKGADLSAGRIDRVVHEFRARYLEPVGDERGERFRSRPCPLLADGRCTGYEHRPRDCRSFAHLHKKDFVTRLAQAVANCSLCPIAFHVIEDVKAELWRR